MKHLRMTLVGLSLCIGCGSAGETKKNEDSAGSAAPAGSATSARVRSTSKESTRQEQPMLGEDQVRVPLIVLPGDALVEVDDVVVRRRNGAVELVGKVGEERRVRVFSGTTHIHEKIVKIEATGTSPEMIDARASATSN